MIIDATNLILGRLASFAAKKALLGENIHIINCENAVISGSEENILERYKRKRQRGIPAKGPFIPRKPDMFVRRVIRGMLPYKKEKGRKAFERIKCYIGIPENFKDKKSETIAEADVSKLPNLMYVKVKNICELLGAKL